MPRLKRHQGRHRLGLPGLVHCVRHPEIAAVLTTRHRGRFALLLTPARHSLAGLRRHAATAALRRHWAPVAS